MRSSRSKKILSLNENQFYVLLSVAIVFGFLANSIGIGVFIIIFVFSVIEIQRQLSNTKKLQEALEIIGEHSQELSIKRRQLTIQKGYGIEEDSKWQKEIGYFIANVISPTVGQINKNSKLYDGIKKLVEKKTENFNSRSIGFHEKMSPNDYEFFVSDTLQDYGWETRVTTASGDQGIDVIAKQSGIKVVLQCKLYSNPVGNAAVQETIAGKTFEQADFAAVVSNASFTKSARQLASSSNVFLLHHEQLGELQNLCGIRHL